MTQKVVHLGECSMGTWEAALPSLIGWGALTGRPVVHVCSALSLNSVLTFCSFLGVLCLEHGSNFSPCPSNSITFVSFVFRVLTTYSEALCLLGMSISIRLAFVSWFLFNIDTYIATFTIKKQCFCNIIFVFNFTFNLYTTVCDYVCVFIYQILTI